MGAQLRGQPGREHEWSRPYILQTWCWSLTRTAKLQGCNQACQLWIFPMPGGCRKAIATTNIIRRTSFMGPQWVLCSWHYCENILLNILASCFQFCLATLYFSDPASICSSGEKTDLLVFQEGPTYKDKLLYVPRTWGEAEPSEWENHFYIPPMGHHRITTSVSNYTGGKSFGWF